MTNTRSASKVVMREVALILSASKIAMSPAMVHEQIAARAYAHVLAALRQLLEEGAVTFSGGNRLRRYWLTDCGRGEYVRPTRNLVDDAMRRRMQAAGDHT